MWFSRFSNESLEESSMELSKNVFKSASKPRTMDFRLYKRVGEGGSIRRYIYIYIVNARRGNEARRGEVTRRQATRRDATRRKAGRQAGRRTDGWTRAGNAITATLIYSIIAEATPSKCRHASSLDPNHSRPSSSRALYTHLRYCVGDSRSRRD